MDVMGTIANPKGKAGSEPGFRMSTSKLPSRPPTSRTMTIKRPGFDPHESPPVPRNRDRDNRLGRHNVRTHGALRRISISRSELRPCRRRLIAPFAAAHDANVNVNLRAPAALDPRTVAARRMGRAGLCATCRVAESSAFSTSCRRTSRRGRFLSVMRDAPYTHVNGKVYAVPEKFGYYGCYNKTMSTRRMP
jgi:hypothetical protein